MTISPSDMLLFASVVREGSFTRAARKLGITKQTASERVGKLEGELGVRLLERTTRQLRLTGSGSLYYERCAALASQVEEANREVQQRDSNPIGLIRIATPTLFGRRYLAPVISEFMREHEKVEIEAVLADRRINLVEDGFDLAIHIGPLEDSSLMVRKLGEATTHIVASPRFLAKHGVPNVNELRDTRCLGLSPFEMWIVGGVRVRVEPVLAVNDQELVFEAAIAGVGIARVPAILCRDAVRAGKLKLLFGDRGNSKRPIQVIYPNRSHLPTTVRLFLDTLAKRVEPMLTLEGRRRGRS